MKKTAFLLISFLVSMPAFAYGYGSDLDDALAWVGILFFIWGILEIILFFKIWGATNDIDKLKSAICDGKKENGMSSYLKKMYLLGKEDEAYNYLNEAFSDEIIKICTECLNDSDSEGYVGFGQSRKLVSVEFNDRVELIRRRYTKHYQSIRREMPQRFYDINFKDLIKIQ